MRFSSRVLYVLGVVVIGACASGSGGEAASGPVQTPERFVTYFRADALAHKTIIAAPLDAVWKAVPEAFRALGYPGAPATNMRGHYFITPNLQITGRLYEGESNGKYLDCGDGFAGPRADAQEVQFVIISRVVQLSATETVIETIIDGSARDRTITSGTSRCTGTGELEQAIADLVKQKVSRRG